MTQMIESNNLRTPATQANVVYNLKDIYTHFIATTTIKLTYTRYKQILLALNEAIFEYVLEGFHFKFPYNLGILRIKKRKLTLNNKKMLKVNFAETKKLGKTIYHLNEHSNGFFYKIAWIRGCARNVRKYSFTPIRKHKRALAQKILVEHKDYLA